MTEYQKIENELKSLGWNQKPGSGDHIKFVKDGINDFIVVSRSIGTEGRALKNTYSQIRKVEPRFSLKRQDHMLEQQEEEVETIIPPDVPAWMLPGTAVRWTEPEKNNFELLAEPTSIMNRKYIVAGYKQAEKEHMVVIHSEEQELDEMFPVFPSELASWELQKCDVCGKSLPKDRILFNYKTKKNYCYKCFTEQTSNIAGTSNKTVEKPAKNIDSQFRNYLDENLELKTLFDSINENLQNKRIMDMSKEELKQLDKEIEEMMERIDPKFKKFLLKKNSVLANIKKFLLPAKLSVYDAWKSALSLINSMDPYFDSFDIHNKKQEAKKIISEIDKKYYSTTYSIENLKNKSTKTNCGTVIHIKTQYQNVALELYKKSDLLFREMKKAFPDNTNLYLLIDCVQANIYQYIIDTKEDRDCYKEKLETLTKCIPENLQEDLSRARLYLELPTYDTVNKELSEIFETFSNDDLSWRIEPSVRPCDEELFETAKAIYNIRLICYNGIYDAVCKMLEYAALMSPATIRVIDRDETKCDDYDFTRNFKFEDKEADKKLIEPETVLLIRKSIEKDGSVTYPIFTADNKEQWKEDFINFLISSAGVSQDFHRMYITALKNFADKADNDKQLAIKWSEMLKIINKNNKTNNDMNEEILNACNENAVIEELASVSTRELLKELRARGVEFEKISITVRKDIDINSL